MFDSLTFEMEKKNRTHTTKKLTNKQLMAGLLSGDRRLQTQVYTYLRSYAFNGLHSVFGQFLDFGTLKDMVQEGLVVLHTTLLERQAKSVSLDGFYPKAFLYRVCFNKATDFSRKKGRRKHQSLMDYIENNYDAIMERSGGKGLVDYDGSLEAIMERNIKEQVLETLLEVKNQQLKPDCKAIIQYRYMENKSAAEIVAAMSGINSVGYARNKLQKCLKYFKVLLLKDQKFRRLLQQMTETGH